MKRRTFLATAVASGAGAGFAQTSLGQEQSSRSDDLNIALLGGGAQGRILMNAILQIPGIRFLAVCDILGDIGVRSYFIIF